MSYTQISQYQSCPLNYKLQYIDGLETKKKWYFSFGQTLHLCAKHFFKVKVPPPPSRDELLRFYEQKWLPMGYESAEEEASYKTYGREILTKFWEIHYADFRMPLAVERMFYVDINGIKLRGYIDRIDKSDSGGLSIVDYKTSKELFTTDDLGKDLQLTLYQLATEQLWQLPVEKLTLYHMRSNTPCSCGPRDKKRLAQTEQLVLAVAENIASQKFPATENQYCPCDFPEHCPYYRQQYAAAALEPPWQATLPGITIDDAVEQYASLQERIKELQLELDKLKEMIIGYCQAKGLNRVFGSKHAITYKLVEMTGFSEDKVRALLEPEGLWERLLSFNPSRMKQLITDEEIAVDTRKKLATLRQVISTSPQLRVKSWRKNLNLPAPARRQ
ncbi:MAG: PD-(D/E)XK nuclease family protein [Dehalococcoidales bacterium]|nr:PD-(D/E)XK nuclease family protein [Dehalococcoidales bacterium]